MFYPIIQENNNTLAKIDTFYGYNHNYKTGYGQFYDSMNISSDFFPVLEPRKTRTTLYKGENLRGVLYADDFVSWLDGCTLHHFEAEIDLSEYFGEDTESQQTMLAFGTYILIFPVGIYINTRNYDDVGRMDAHFRSAEDIEITITLSSKDGLDINAYVGDEAPENPTTGQYWLSTALGSEGLNIYYGGQKSWQPVATTYLRIDIPGANLTDYFSEGDTVFMNSEVKDINNGSLIQAITDEYIVVTGIMSELSHSWRTSEAWQFTIDRKLPRLDFVCVHGNRVWGCHYGYHVEESRVLFVNEIYACKLGDFKNWYTYTGLADDSYSLSVGSPGQWTGCISYNGCPTFFKEDAILKIYGSMPSDYTLITTNARGVQIGSDRSLVQMGEYLVYKSPYDVCVFDGSAPVSISEPLGRELRFYAGVAGMCGNKYYLKLENAAGTNYYFIYDMGYGLWEREDALDIKCFSQTWNGQMFAITDTELLGYGTTDNYLYLKKEVGEEWVEWYATTGDMGLDIPSYKYVSQLTIRAYIARASEIAIYISYDDRDYEPLTTIRGYDTLFSEDIRINPFRCDHFKIKFAGHGDCRIYNLAIQYTAGSEEDNGFI